MGDCDACVYNVFHKQNVSVLAVCRQVFCQNYVAGALGATAVTGCRDKIHFHVQVHCAHKVSKENPTALQNSHKQWVFVGVVLGNLVGKFLDASCKLLFSD